MHLNRFHLQCNNNKAKKRKRKREKENNVFCAVYSKRTHESERHDY